MNAYLQELKALKSYYFILPCIIVISYSVYHFASPGTAIFLGKEDHFFEWLTAICLMGCCVYFFLSFRKYRNLYFLLLALLMFFGAGEEISWGQRIFGYATPENVKELNVQGEFTLHNLEVFNGKQFDKARRSGIQQLLEIDMLFKIFMISFGIVLPLMVWHSKIVSTLVQKIRLPVPPVSIGIYFFVAWLGRVVILHYLQKPQPEEDHREYWALVNAASEYYEFLVSAVLLSISFFFYKNRYRDLMGHDIKQVLNN